MKEKQNNWQRIEAVIKWANMSTNFFARHIGLPRGENLYQIKRGNNGISLDVAEKIVNKFPQIDKLWLLTGDGQMFADTKTKGVQIPFYSLDPEQEIAHYKEHDPESYLYLPMLKQCDLAFCYTGRAMGELVPPETICMFRAVETQAIIPGETYLVETPRFSALRILRATDTEDKFRLVPGDKENYDELFVNRAEITAAYKLIAKLIINR